MVSRCQLALPLLAPGQSKRQSLARLPLWEKEHAPIFSPSPLAGEGLGRGGRSPNPLPKPTNLSNKPDPKTVNLKNLLLSLTFLLPIAAQAQSITPAQIEQFKSLPKAQQEALASQYGVDLSALGGVGQSTNQRPQPVQVIEPIRSPQTAESGNEPETKAETEETKKNGGLKPYGYDLFAGNPTTFAPVTE